MYFQSGGERAENYGLPLGYVVPLLLGQRHPKEGSEAAAAWPETTEYNLSIESCKTAHFSKSAKHVNAQSGCEMAEN